MPTYLSLARRTLHRVGKKRVVSQPQQQPSMITSADRQAACQTAFHVANQLYRGGAIDWLAVERACESLQRATTRRQLREAADAYVAAVAGEGADHADLCRFLDRFLAEDER